MQQACWYRGYGIHTTYSSYCALHTPYSVYRSGNAAAAVYLHHIRVSGAAPGGDTERIRNQERVATSDYYIVETCQFVIKHRLLILSHFVS